MKIAAKSLVLAGAACITAIIAATTFLAAAATPEKQVSGQVVPVAERPSPSNHDGQFPAEAPEIRCYFRADLTTTYPAPNAPDITMPPYLLTGREDPFDTNKMPTSSDPVRLCADLWDRNFMNPGGITNDLIPAGFKQASDDPAPASTGQDRDSEGNAITPSAGSNQHGHYIPELTACLVDNAVAVIPDPAACGRLGLASAGTTTG
jgi:hypothetical protein